MRRFTKRVYVRMPDVETRTKLVTNLLETIRLVEAIIVVETMFCFNIALAKV